MRLRIGFDAWGLSGALLYTGMGQYARHVIGGIAADAAFDVVAYGAPREPRPAWLPETVAWRTPSAPVPRKTAAIATRVLVMRRGVAVDRLDVLHVPALHLRPSLPPVPSAPCPVVTTVHDVIPLTSYAAQLPWRLRAFYRWNLHRALRSACVITVSNTARNEIVDRAGSDASRVVAIPNGIDFASNPDRAPLERRGIGRPYVLYAGSYEPRKNLRGALTAYARLADNGAEQDMVAIVERDSGHAAGAHAQIARLGIGGRVHLLHSLDDAEVRALYTHAEALLFPSFAEGFGFPPLQAAACGVPVVASDIPAVRETMGASARYVDPADAASIAAGLRDVLRDAQIRAHLVEGARERARRFTWSESVAAHAAVYERVARRSRVQADRAAEGVGAGGALRGM